MDYDAIEDIENALPNVNDIYDPNTIIATINSITDANQFCNTYNHNNGYNGLKLGQIIRINDGSYNNDWYIAGFDCEYNHTASDGTIKDNGYGICLIPTSELISSKWCQDNTEPVSYIESIVHVSTLPTIANSLKNVLGDHLVNRNVLLGSKVSTEKKIGTISYTWTTAYCTLMSVGQITGTFASYNNKYDDGEANYKLPLFNYTVYRLDSSEDFFTRCAYGLYYNSYFDPPLTGYKVWSIYYNSYSSNNIAGDEWPHNSLSICPLIYIR